MRFRDKMALAARMAPYARILGESNELLHSVDGDLQGYVRTDKTLESGELSAAWGKVAKPGEVLDLYKKVLDNRAVAGVFSKFAGDFKEETRPMLGQATMVNGLFYVAASRTPREDIMSMISLMRNSSVLRSSAMLEPKWSSGGGEVIFEGMRELVKNAAPEDKPRVFMALDNDVYLPHRMKTQSPILIAGFIADAFKGVETETALRTLRHSQSWKGVRKDNRLAESILDVDKRFYEAMDY